MMDCCVCFLQAMIWANVDCLRDFPGGRLNALDLAGGIEGIRYLDAKVDVHRFARLLRMVVEEDIQSGVWNGIVSEEDPDFIESRLPRGGDSAGWNRGADRS
jgi:hypothetical protein